MKIFNCCIFLLTFQLLAVVRAHVTALGGNAMVSFYMSELILGDHPHKNQVRMSIKFPLHVITNLIWIIFQQGQTLISVGGDVVSVVYANV